MLWKERKGMVQKRHAQVWAAVRQCHAPRLTPSAHRDDPVYGVGSAPSSNINRNRKKSNWEIIKKGDRERESMKGRKKERKKEQER